VSVQDFKDHPSRKSLLSPIIYDIPEVHIQGSKRRLIRFGEPVYSIKLYSAVMTSDLNHYAIGKELGVINDVKKRVLIRTIHLNVHECTFDTMSLRINVYKVNSDGSTHNLLIQPVYVSFSKEDITEEVVFDVSEYSIIVVGKVLISLEAYKFLGKGEFIINRSDVSGNSFGRRAKEGEWRKSRGRLGLYFYVQKVN
jgi:hypothetical protein